MRRLVIGLTLLLFGCGDSGSPPPPPPAPSQPAAPPASPAPVLADALYKQYCAGCHGPDGKGNGPAAAALPVKPADHTNPAVMSKISDAELFKAIKEGGQAVGKSPAMPPWGGTLKDDQVHALVAYVRSLARPR
jgi:mono/diheme cytochrome c family protein